MTMNPEVRERLITGLAQQLSAEASGSARSTVADAYLGMDNYLSALLLSDNIAPSHNHVQKLKLVLGKYPNLLRDALASQADLEAFYTTWQNARYTNTYPTPNECIRYRRLAYRVMSEITKKIAAETGLSHDQLEEELYTEVVGSRWTGFEEQIDQLHEARQQHLEIMGEMGYGSKLSNKLHDPINFCDVRALADDPITRELVSTDEQTATIVHEMYSQFLHLIEHLQAMRYGRVEDPEGEGEFLSFALSLRFSYQGQSSKEIAEDFGRMVRAMEQDLKEGGNGTLYRT